MKENSSCLETKFNLHPFSEKLFVVRKLGVKFSDRVRRKILQHIKLYLEERQIFIVLKLLQGFAVSLGNLDKSPSRISENGFSRLVSESQVTRVKLMVRSGSWRDNLVVEIRCLCNILLLQTVLLPVEPLST